MNVTVQQSPETIKVMIVDDQAFIRDLIRRTLSRFGYQDIVEASDGEAALSLVTGALPDIIVCDINMKPMNGFQFLENLRKLPHPISTIPVIILTAAADEAFVQKARAMRVVRYLVKASMVEKLDPTIRQVVSAYARI